MAEEEPRGGEEVSAEGRRAGTGAMHRGLLWLGAASAVSRFIEVPTIIIVLWFLTRAEMGVATTAWSIAVIVEAFNGLGIGTALLQSKKVEADQYHSVFWYVTGLSLLFFLAISAAAPLIAWIYEAPELTWMIVASAVKLPLVGAALVPLQRLNRGLRFRQLGAVNSGATLGSSLVKIGLAVSGFGAWSLVLAHTAHGLFTLILVLWAEPFMPRLCFAFHRIKEMARFGLRVATSGVIYHFYRNADYLIVGKFLGQEALGLYRVAFELAMTPALMVLQVVNRAALPVFSRLNEDRAAMSAVFLWTQRNLAMLILPVVTFLIATRSTLLLTVAGEKWAIAGALVVPLALAAWVRCHAQVFPQLFHATGHPAYAVMDAVASVLVLTGGFLLAIWLFGDDAGALAVCWVWLGSYPFLMTLLVRLARRLIPLELRAVWAVARHPLQLALSLGVVGTLLGLVEGMVPWPWAFVGMSGVAVLGCTLFYVRRIMGVRLKQLLRASEAPALGST